RWEGIYQYESVNDVLFETKLSEKVWYRDQLLSAFTSDKVVVSKPYQPHDFTLSAFGFPEPSYYESPRPWWLYISIIGLVVAIGGGIMMKNRRRRTS
ncbi:MAG: hypothetical protein Q8M16_09500, partial [Pirellulaceae bacterium]|nr:hypothetical protein [Pirellulaceae bacterium]